MKKIIKITSVLMLMMVMVLSMAGCGGSNSSSEEQPAEETAEQTEEPAETQEAAEPAAEPIGIHHAEIVIKDFGTVKVELDGDKAPITVQNFMDLANAGFYDGVRFDSVKYVGNYFLVSKNTSGEIINRIILLYAVEVSAEGEPSKNYYHAVAFNNLMRYDASSGYVDLNDFETYGDDLELFSLVSLCGYRIYTDFVGNCIDSQRTNFNVETTIEEGNLPF